MCVFFFKQKTAYEMRISDWSSDVCSSDLPPGATRTLTISGSVNASAGATVVNSAEISASSAPDSDSTPGNGGAGEDDQANASFTVSGSRMAGAPPALTCPAGSTIFDWDGIAWSAGTTSGRHGLAGIERKGHRM